ncbi:hypothetical protein WN51_07659 [Melipona quadrifasciata]|uniref:Uncharacterized protein n=1 Tax=Melipona quadrifasciata TaxID=166423 RepID=A0A0M8ZQB8_9HYME|nr:hypothetical protein WN51_07659 [Melipona quadrifasciata]
MVDDYCQINQKRWNYTGHKMKYKSKIKTGQKRSSSTTSAFHSSLSSTIEFRTKDRWGRDDTKTRDIPEIKFEQAREE